MTHLQDANKAFCISNSLPTIIESLPDKMKVCLQIIEKATITWLHYKGMEVHSDTHHEESMICAEVRHTITVLERRHLIATQEMRPPIVLLVVK